MAKILKDIILGDQSKSGLGKAKRAEIVAAVLDRIDNPPSPADGETWDRCWRDMADKLRAEPYQRSLLTPTFLSNHQVARWNGDFKEVDSDFIVAHDEMIRCSVFTKWFASSTEILELGCGSGRNLALLAEMYPDAELMGSDHSFFSRDIVGHMADALGKHIPWYACDMRTLSGFSELPIKPDATSILTVHAMEQLGKNYELLFDALVAARPAIIVNLEPLNDLYDETKEFDHLAALYHKRRGYLDGWLNFLKDQEKLNKIVILDQQRFGLGDMYHEAYSLVCWRPFE